MALIECPACKRKVSEEAASCPHCGQPITQQVVSKAKKDASDVKQGWAILLLILLAFLGYKFFNAYQQDVAASPANKAVHNILKKAGLIDKAKEASLYGGQAILFKREMAAFWYKDGKLYAA